MGSNFSIFQFKGQGQPWVRRPRIVRWTLWMAMGLVLTACQGLPSHEYEPFVPLPPEKRIMNEVRVRWEVRSDVAEFCSRAIQMGQGQAFSPPPMACALWDVARKECTVVTGPRPNHVVLGHEVRHCFEGRFHP